MTAHWKDIAGETTYSPQYPFVKTRSERIHRTSVSTNVPTRLVPEYFRNLTKVLHMMSVHLVRRIYLGIALRIVYYGHEIYQRQHKENEYSHKVKGCEGQVMTE